MKRRVFLNKIFSVAGFASLFASKANAFGLFTTSFWKKRATVAPWLVQSNTMDYFGSGAWADSPIGIGARACRMGDNTIGMIAGVAGNTAGVAAYITGSASGAFTINGQYTPAATYTDSLGDQLEIECVKSTTSNQYYAVWCTGNSSYGLHAAKINSNAAGTAANTSFVIGGTGAGAYPSSGAIAAAVNSSDQLMIFYYYPSALRWSLLTSALAVTSSKNSSASIPTSAFPISAFSSGTDFFAVCASTSSNDLIIAKINSSGTYVSHSVFALSNSLAPAQNNRGEAIYISATSVILVWRSKTGLAVFANYNPSTSTFSTSAMDLGFSNQSINAVVAAKNSTNQIVVNYGQYFKMVDTTGAEVKPLIQVTNVRGGSGGIVFRSSDTRLVLVETINVSTEKSGLYAREFTVS